MPKASGDGGQRGPDLLAVVLLGLLAVAAIAALYGVVTAGYVTAGALLGLIGVGGAFVLLHSRTGKTAPPKNTFTHGAARPASDAEAQAAARGAVKAREIHEQKFDE